MSGPRNAEDRLRRLLVMLPWLMETGEVPLAEVARRYEMTEAQVQDDLELVAMCGLPPFIDEMIDVFVDDGVVFVGVPRLFTRPLRLTAPEAFSLLASARTAMQLPGADRDGALGRGLAKLAAVLADAGIATTNDDDTAGVVVDLARPDLTDVLAESAATGSELAITYFSPARAEMSSRAIVPRDVYTDGGNWYVVADDDRSHLASNVPCRPDRVGRSDRPDGRGRGDLATRTVLRRRRRAEGDDPVRSGRPMGVGSIPRRRGRRVGRRMGRGSTAGCQRTMVGQVAHPARPRRRARRAGEPESCRRGRSRGCSPATARRERSADVERFELLGLGDAVRREEMGEHRCGRSGVAEGVVRPFECDPETLAHVAEPVRQLPIGVEATRTSAGCTVEARGRVGTGSSLGRRRVARAMNSLSNAALCAVNTAPFILSPNSSSASSSVGAPRNVARVIPWMLVGPTRCSGQRSLTSDDHWSTTEPSAWTTTMPN